VQAAVAQGGSQLVEEALDARPEPAGRIVDQRCGPVRWAVLAFQPPADVTSMSR
jgi:hypothetical protein